MTEATSLWDPALPFPEPATIDEPRVITHVRVHQAVPGEYQFLHGSAVIAHGGTLFIGFANSPVDENSTQETMRVTRSVDGGRTWTSPAPIAPPLPGDECHSHGVFLSRGDDLWCFVPRFRTRSWVPAGTGGIYPGLKTEAFVHDAATSDWHSRGIVVEDFVAFEEPMELPCGAWIMGGEDHDTYPAVAISDGPDLTRWERIQIPVPTGAELEYAETTLIRQGTLLKAIVRNTREHVALISVSRDWGRTWSEAAPSNLPIAPSRAYAGTLSTGQWYVVGNLEHRKRLVIAASSPGEPCLSRVWRIRHGAPVPPLYPGKIKKKTPQWSYPHACEFQGNLYVSYSIGKEDCGLAIIPVGCLHTAGGEETGAGS